MKHRRGQFRAKLAIHAATIALIGLTNCQVTGQCDQTCADTANQAIVARAELDRRANAGDRPSIEQIIREEWAGSGESEAWLFAIVQRESNFEPWAHNSEGASGIFQLMLPMHDGQFTAVGCQPSQWADARCNARAARHLYDAAGRSPWYLAGWHQ